MVFFSPSAALALLASSLLSSSPAVRAATAAPPAAGYFSPLANGGGMYTLIPGLPGQGEPLNVIVSAKSDPQVLTPTGFLNYMQSIQFSTDCLGLHNGTIQSANLGDGQGSVPQVQVLRYDYGNAAIGTCQESARGGNHLRYWFQNGTAANSGAIFLATSVEEPAAEGHMIVPDGYNAGRDWLVGNATASNGTTANGFVYHTTSQIVPGLLQATSDNVNHATQVGVNGQPAVDGHVAVLTVAVSKNGSVAATASTSSSSSSTPAAALVSSQRSVLVASLALLVGGGALGWSA